MLWKVTRRKSMECWSGIWLLNWRKSSRNPTSNHKNDETSALFWVWVWVWSRIRRRRRRSWMWQMLNGYVLWHLLSFIITSGRNKSLFYKYHDNSKYSHGPPESEAKFEDSKYGGQKGAICCSMRTWCPSLVLIRWERVSRVPSSRWKGYAIVTKIIIRVARKTTKWSEGWSRYSYQKAYKVDDAAVVSSLSTHNHFVFQIFFQTIKIHVLNHI